MKTSVIAALGLAASVSAQANLPACATTCALTAIGSTGCEATDAECICTKPSFLSGVEGCIQDACSEADIQATLAYAQSFCGSAGVSISMPEEAPAPATSMMESEDYGAASTTVVVSSGMASVNPYYSSEATPAVSQITDGQPQAPTSQAAPAVSQISDGQPQAPTSQAPAEYTGAAAPLQKNLMGGLAAVALGAVAAL